jgi:glucose-6-phosphate 1-dehydrogenase
MTMAHTIVIFGASGDLTRRKLIPALYRLHRQGRLPAGTRIVGVSRTAFSHEAWREQLAESTAEFTDDDFDTTAFGEFAANVFYQPGDVSKSKDFAALATLLDEIEGEASADRIYYLSIMPQLYGATVARLGAAGLADEDKGRRRVVIEKPFGTDLDTARQLNAEVHEVFKERQVFRIDHYLGKETVQNLLVLRFGNSIFEPLWNRHYVDHVQITVAESVDVGSRGGYYDRAGVLRDMFQNHLLQLMMVTAMESPARFEADQVRDEKVKVLRSVKPLAGADFAQETLRGQYDGYLDEEGVPDDSQTATFAILKLHVHNWRWRGVPFYLRCGKAMSCRTTQIVVQFKDPPHLLFQENVQRAAEANRLVVQIQPNEGIQLRFQTKVPEAGMRLQMSDLDFRFGGNERRGMPDAYCRLLLDALHGDASLFARGDEVELAWQIIDPILAAWRSPAAPPLQTYERGQWGPVTSTQWMYDQGREWFDVCPVLH